MVRTKDEQRLAVKRNLAHPRAICWGRSPLPEPTGGAINYATVACSNISSSKCSGTLDAISAVVDWRFAPKVDAYAGVMLSEVNNGLANGYLYHTTIDPTVGLRFRF